MKGQDVEQLQTKLKKLGFNTGNIDRDFRRWIEAAVINLQKCRGLISDVIAESITQGVFGLKFINAF